MRLWTVAERTETGEEGQEYTYEYSVVVDEISVSPGIACESYGVRVRRQDGEEGLIPNITVSAGRIGQLMELLVRNGVTPCTLRDVVDDWL